MKLSELLDDMTKMLAAYDGDPATKKFAIEMAHVILAGVANFGQTLELDMTHDEVMNHAFPGLYPTDKGANDNVAQKSAA